MERTVRDIPEMYMEVMTLLRMQGVEHQSRNGPVLTIEEPVTFTVRDPEMRVLTDPVRLANPFFHALEFVWMMAGSQDPQWISTFNKRMMEYADRFNVFNKPLIHGSYGHRWRHHFEIDQILRVVDMLRTDPDTRRAVLGMWDPMSDLDHSHADLPCNTHIYFRIVADMLDMTVCNRSNDAIWGMCGANAVHMTLLHELVANAIGKPVGHYRVMTNNLHVYTELPNVKELLSTTLVYYPPRMNEFVVPVLREDEDLETFLSDCEAFVNGGDWYKSEWLKLVAEPMIKLWFQRDYGAHLIADTNWRYACENWLRLKAK